MRRREFLALLSTVAGTLVSSSTTPRLQPATPTIGFLDPRSVGALTDRLRGFRQGLRESGYIEGENVNVLYRLAEYRRNQLPQLATELVHRPVAVVIASGGPDVTFALKALTTTIPILFLTAEDPVRSGLVTSLARPGGNLTGVNFFNRELVAKQLELLRELVPTVNRVAVLVNPANPAIIEQTLRDVGKAAPVLGLQIQIFRASTSGEIDAAFAMFARERPDGLFVTADPFFNSRRVQLALLSAHYSIAAVYSGREFAEVGGLLTYGSDIADAYRQVGVYAGRILKGAKPAELPVVQANKFELIINAQTARTLGIAVPPSLLARADEVIE
jgi:putative ABC transport system substrate-binding protein